MSLKRTPNFTKMDHGARTTRARALAIRLSTILGGAHPGCAHVTKPDDVGFDYQSFLELLREHCNVRRAGDVEPFDVTLELAATLAKHAKNDDERQAARAFIVNWAASLFDMSTAAIDEINAVKAAKGAA